jgi:hypothetical protein
MAVQPTRIAERRICSPSLLLRAMPGVVIGFRKAETTRTLNAYRAQAVIMGSSVWFSHFAPASQSAKQTTPAHIRAMPAGRASIG